MDDEKKPLYGPKSPQEEFDARAKESNIDINNTLYRPLENLKYKDFLDMQGLEKLRIEEALRSSIMDGPISLSRRLENSIEGFNYARQHYTVQNDLERASGQITMMEDLMFNSKEGSNERLIGLTLEQLVRHESSVKIFSWALPYKAKYYSGMETLGILPERGEQLALANMSRVMQGVKAEWIEKTPEGITELEKDKWEKVREALPLVEKGETLADRYGRYVADADFWTRVVGEMNTYNPTNKGEKLYISETMQKFVGDLLKRRQRTYEDGKTEDIKLPTRKIVVYLDSKGNQIPFGPDGKPIDKDPDGNPVVVAEKLSAYVEVLDYYGKSRSEEEIRWVVSAISAMSLHDAKSVLDSLPQNVESLTQAENNTDASKYNTLFSSVQNTANEMMANYDIPRRINLNYKLARSGFYLADAIGFASLDIANRGFNNEWKLVSDGRGNYIWHVESAQADPTASGDAFSAARPYFHEIVYQGVKNRISANNNGVLLPVDEKEAEKLAQVYVSEAAEINERAKIIETIVNGKQKHLAKYFGILGSFEKELGHLPEWQEGKNKRESLGKEVNPNLSKTIEESVVFVPTPFKDANGDKLIYPMIAAQYKIGLFDMLSAGKEYTVGDLLRKTWKKENGVLIEALPEKGGKRLTYRDIDWMQYARYADDSRAVNNNFMLQIFAPLYGPLNSKQLETVSQNPSAAITAAIKAGDIGLRSVIKKFKNPTKESGPTALRSSLEIMHAASIVFQQLALGVHGLIGRDSVERYNAFTSNLSPVHKKDAHLPDNLYTTLRNVEDFLKSKQGYTNYSDSFFCAFLAMTAALEPITIASNEMAYETTKIFKKTEPTETTRVHKLALEEDKNVK